MQLQFGLTGKLTTSRSMKVNSKSRYIEDEILGKNCTVLNCFLKEKVGIYLAPRRFNTLIDICLIDTCLKVFQIFQHSETLDGNIMKNRVFFQKNNLFFDRSLLRLIYVIVPRY